MTTVADTSVLIDNLRGMPAAQRAFVQARASGEMFAASTMAKVEILAGMLPEEEEATAALLAELEWIAVDDEVAERAGELARKFRRAHPGVEVVDYVVAATAQLLGARLWTQNVKHFPMFPGLEPPY